jgi:hypothetical protein
LLADPCFRDAKMLGELASVQKPWKSVALGLGVALGEEPPKDLRFERLEGRCALGGLFEDIAQLLVCEAVRVVWVRDQIVKRDFWRCSHGWLIFSKSVQPA